jgi:protein-S-isoprenylcysteine O-methyltransferase Ste14
MTCIWARRTLAGNWSSLPVLKKDHDLVQDGPYKFVRHPIYTGFLLMFLGTALAIGRLGGFIGFAVCFMGFWIKLRQEEALMIKRFRGNYLSYKKRVKALIPYLF